VSLYWASGSSCFPSRLRRVTGLSPLDIKFSINKNEGSDKVKRQRSYFKVCALLPIHCSSGYL
jgi:hypothetical protein